LERLGFEQVRQTGSHVVLKQESEEGEIGCVAPVHREMNVTAASGRCITSLHSHASRLDSAQQHPSEAVLDGRSKLRGIDPQGLKVGTLSGILKQAQVTVGEFIESL
jgi:predicted RNA binding protein YcfA (HicA-like mRNA interferase family)